MSIIPQYNGLKNELSRLSQIHRGCERVLMIFEDDFQTMDYCP
jgi:hypothetical protein